MFGKIITRGRNSGLKCLSTGSLPPFPSLSLLFFPKQRACSQAIGPILCSDWSKLDGWVHVKNLCSILKLVYFDSWSWQSFESTCDVLNSPFPLDVQNEIQLLSRVFCYLWLVCFLGFCLRKASLVKVGNPISDGIVFVFTLLDA